MYPLTITLHGRPASKKNNKRIVEAKDGNQYLISSEAHGVFEANALDELLFYKRPHLEEPIHIEYIFYRKGKLPQDVDNAIGTINDVLQAGGVIENDSYIEEGTFKIVKGATEWKTTVIISPCKIQ